MFRYVQPVLFKHCDPAGIVFYPRYFEMINDCMEQFFDERLKWPFHEIHASAAVPTVEITTRFKAPSRHGDKLDLALGISKVGRTSCGFALEACCSGQERFASDLTLVHVNKDGKPSQWPDTIKARLQQLKECQEQ